jgi:hypothetical protein
MEILRDPSGSLCRGGKRGEERRGGRADQKLASSRTIDGHDPPLAKIFTRE